MNLLYVVMLYLGLLTVYISVHELLHFLSARMLKCRVSIGVIRMSTVLPSIGLNVICRNESTVSKLVILYIPYVVNVILVTYGLYMHGTWGYLALLIGVLTLPNALLEDEGFRISVKAKLRNLKYFKYFLGSALASRLYAVW